MKPVIAIVGRPNVGKSTLFNRLTQTRDALVADRPGVTRDRQFGIGDYDDKEFLLIDTGGIGELAPDNKDVANMVEDQSLRAIEEADVVIWMVDGRDGLNANDERLGQILRGRHQHIYLAVNKLEGMIDEVALADYYRLGFGEPQPLSAKRGDGLADLMALVFQHCDFTEDNRDEHPGLRITVLGRPNVGKSTLINRILGEERVITCDYPGTTRDSIEIPFSKEFRGIEKDYVLIDTAGVRRKAKVQDEVEKFSVVKSFQAIHDAEIIIIVLDGQEAITDQDLNLIGQCQEQGKPMIVAVNKWDGLETSQRTVIEDQLDYKLGFVQKPFIHLISALHGSGVGLLFESILKIDRSLQREVPTSEISNILHRAIEQHQPPMVRGRRIKLRFAHSGGKNPFRIVIHGNQLSEIPESYTRYLSNYYQKHLRLEGIPVLIHYRQGDNPFAGKKNVLSKRQQEKRRRLMRHVKGKK